MGIPTPKATPLAPYSSFILFRFSATSLRASCQDIFSHFPSPLFPALFRGCMSRSGWVRRSGEASPFGHMYPLFKNPSGSPFTFTILLSLTPTISAQPPWSILAQWVFIQRISSVMSTPHPVSGPDVKKSLSNIVLLFCLCSSIIFFYIVLDSKN